MTPALLLLAMSLVAYRITRLVVEDTIIDRQRMWVINKLNGGKRTKNTRAKVAYLISCPFCSSFYISAAVVLITDQFANVPLPWLTWLAVWGATAVVWNATEK